MSSELPSGWESARLENCMSAIIDYRGKSPQKAASGVPLITAKIVKDGRIAEPTEFIAEADYDAWMRRGLPEQGDVLVTTEAPLGEVAQLDGGRVALAQRLILLRGDPVRLQSGFLKYAMQSSFVQSQLKARSTGTTVLGIRQSELRKVVLPLPPLGEQRRIAGTLGAIDDKIELNRRMNDTLESTARTVFEAWFVDRRQAREKEGDLDWSTAALGSVVEVSRLAMSSAELRPLAVDHHSIPAFDAGRTPALEDGATIKSNKFVVTTGTVLVSRLNPRIPRIWLPHLSDRVAVCSTEFLVLRPGPSLTVEFLYCLLSSNAFGEELASRVTGTSGSHQRVKPADALSIEVVMPPHDLMHRFSTLVAPLLQRAGSVLAENQRLGSLRDALLPRLLSGELTRS